MSWSLPKLPGYSFQDPTKTQFYVPRKLNYINGFPIVKNDNRGIGGLQMDIDGTTHLQTRNDKIFDPSMIYGSVNKLNLPIPKPHFVRFDKKFLIFKAYYKQKIHNTAYENIETPRYVNIIYYLEDDTITVVEPHVQNSGLWQGKMIKRGKIPKGNSGFDIHWKDLNIGIDVVICGLTFHIISCDDFTKRFLESQGIEVVEDEQTDELQTPPQTYERHNVSAGRSDSFRNLQRFLEYDDKLFQFEAVWENCGTESDEDTKYKILYYLYDNTIAVKERQTQKSGRETLSMFLRRTKLPKNWKKQPIDSQIIVRDNDVADEYYGAEDLIVGSTINILGRIFLLYDCDAFTRNYYKSILNIEQGQPMQLSRHQEQKRPVMDVPPHIGIGDPEDTLMSCVSFHSKPPFKNLVQYNLNTNKHLRYLCEMLSVHPEDAGRKFILSYRLADSTICVEELPAKNSGLMGGRFSGPCRVLVPEHYTLCYTPEMFYIGSIIKINRHRFRIIGADLYVYHYMMENPDKFPSEVIQNVRDYHVLRGNLKHDQQADATPNVEISTGAQNVFNLDEPDQSTLLREDITPDGRVYQSERWEPTDLPPPIQGLECTESLPEHVDERYDIEGSRPQPMVCLTGLDTRPDVESRPTHQPRQYDIQYQPEKEEQAQEIRKIEVPKQTAGNTSTTKRVTFGDLPKK